MAAGVEVLGVPKLNPVVADVVVLVRFAGVPKVKPLEAWVVDPAIFFQSRCLFCFVRHRSEAPSQGSEAAEELLQQLTQTFK